MIYDFYACFQVERKDPNKSREEIKQLTKERIKQLTNGSGEYSEITNVLSRVMLLITAYAVENKLPNGIDPVVYARIGEKNNPMGLKALVHSKRSYDEYLREKLKELNGLGVNSPVDSSSLPKGSWILEFPITLAKSLMSKDDIPFYIIENPVRKDKVFGVPFTSATSWKGNLRWTMMKVFLEPAANDPDKFAQIRFRHVLLFGTEKGWGEAKSWACHLDNLCPDAGKKYEDMLKDKFNKDKIKDMHLQGMLYFYSTFWNKIDMHVINPHSRKTKTGKNPVYFEIVPAGANGTFRLVYIPFHWFGSPEDELKDRVIEDLRDVITGVRKMMLDYGFSAKKSLGFGIIKNEWDKDGSRLEVKGFYDVKKFSNFEELEEIVGKWRDENV